MFSYIYIVFKKKYYEIQINYLLMKKTIRKKITYHVILKIKGPNFRTNYENIGIKSVLVSCRKICNYFFLWQTQNFSVQPSLIEF